MRSKVIVVTFLLAATLAAAGSGQSARGPLDSLFLEPPPGAAAPSGDLGTLRSRPVDINFEALVASASALEAAAGRNRVAIRLDLFTDASYVAVLDRITYEWKTNFSWIGHLEGTEGSQVVLVAGGGVLVGSIRLPDAAYRVRYTPEGVHVIEEVDLDAFPEEAEPVVIDEQGELMAFSPAPEWFSIGDEEPDVFSDALLASSTAIDDGTNFDLLVVYTPAARAAAGGTAAIENLIALGVTEANIAYANSLIVPRLSLAFTTEVSYTEAGDIGIDLSRLQAPSDGYMDNVHSLRNSYRADLVKLVGNSTAGGCGIAYLMAGSNNRAFEAWAFSVTARTCISPNYTFAHELGHNMGSNHASGDPTGTGAFSYSFGYKNPSALFRTVMAYDCSPSCPRVLYFSTPAVTYLGNVVGTTTRNNAASITNVRSVVSSFRLSQTGPTCSGTSGQWSGCRGHGCAVCVEKVASYPLYYHNHPLCSPNTTCGGLYFTCNSNCPTPTSTDLCNGTSGQWQGCRGDGCSVCMEKLASYPLYFHNHPACKRNDTCAGLFFTCNSNCPAPASADRCDGTSGQWQGCRGNGCAVCAELVAAYPCYFKNHPLCTRNTTCQGSYFTCNANCPAPTEADRC